MSRTQNLCPQQMLRARANGETFVSSTMCLQQCVLVCQGLNPHMRTWLTRLTEQVLIYLGFKMANFRQQGFKMADFRQQVLEPVGSCTSAFTVIQDLGCHCHKFFQKHLSNGCGKQETRSYLVSRSRALQLR